MARYRIGNDITVVWTVNDRNGDAFPLEDKDVHLYYTCERGRFEADIKIKDTNKIVWDFYGSLQKALGVYSLTLVILQSEGKRSIKKDICNAFTFVGKDCEADAPADYADGDLAVYQKTITTDLDVLRINPIVPTIEKDENGIGYWVIDGVNTGEKATAEGAYELAKRYGYEGTEEEFAQLLMESPDWSAAEGEPGYIKNKPFGLEDKINEYIFAEDEMTIDPDNEEYPYSHSTRIQLNNEFKSLQFVYQGVRIYETRELVLDEGYYSDSLDLYSSKDSIMCWLIASIGTNDDGSKYLDIEYSSQRELSGLKVVYKTLGYKTIGEEFIPDTIARTSDLNEKVDKEEGKGLSTNDYTSAEKNKLASLENYDDSGLRAALSQLNNAKASKEDVEELTERIAENEVLIEDLQDSKIDKEADDYYPQLSVGVADNLSGVEVVDSSFTTRQSGGGAITDGVARVQSIKGNSVVWNQLALSQGAKGSYDNSAGDSISYQQAGLQVNYTTAINDHKIFCIVKDRIGDVPFFYFTDNVQLNLLNGIIYTANTTLQDRSGIIAQVPAGVNASWDIDCLFVDLTKMFGEGNEPSTIEEFNARLPLGVDLYAYNEGEVISMNVNGINSVGVKEGEESTEDLSIVAKYFPNGMNGVGSEYDEIRYNKAANKWEKVQRFSKVDMGTLSYSKSSVGTNAFYTIALHGIVKKGGKMISAIFELVGGITDANKFLMSVDTSGTIYFNCPQISDTASFKVAMSGVILYYELAEPIVTEIEEKDFNLDYLVWNGGTEEAIASKPSSALRAEITYGFNAVGKIKELEEKINSGGGGGVSKEYVDTKVTELSSQVSGLSKRVDNLPTAESSVFEAEYGVTTFAVVKAANEAGKVVICNYNGYVFRLTRVMDSELTFVANNVGYIHLLYLTKFDVWWSNYADVRHGLKDLDNGNVQLTIAGKSAEVATPQYVDEKVAQSGGGGGTPSGEPMHYMFEAVGATYNATDADIPMVGIYGDSYVHKAKHWHLNELGDITNEEMRAIYNERYPTKTMRYMQEWFREASARTTLSSLTQVSSTQGNNIGYKAQCETILFTADINGEIMLANLSDGFYQAKNLRKILGVLNMSSATAIGATSCLCSNLEYVRFKGVKVSANLSLAPKLSNASILYMIENATATGITITLHADAYDRAMADSAITAAMESKQVNLAKA